MKNVIIEFCAENFTDIPRAVEAGANRIELCDNLTAGGTTPSIGVVEQTLAYCKPRGIDVMVMIRPRGGNFEYNSTELAIMLNDIEVIKELNPTGFVFGALKNGFIDMTITEKLLKACQGLETTFHMAFDQIDQQKQLEAIDWLANHQVTRILTHGGLADQPIEAHFDRLNKYIKQADNRIGILPGGGVHADNLNHVQQELNTGQYHGTKIVKL